MTNKKDITIYWFISAFILTRFIFIFNNDLIVEEAYYWNYAQHLDYSYLDHPPMIALLIKFGTMLFGNHEWAVRFMDIPCWLITALFSYKLSELISKGSGIYAIFFLAMLPFFFIYSIVLTPDTPLIAAWSATLYYLYKSTVCQQKNAWYWSGISIGLGMLSKYTIILPGSITIVYLLLTPNCRYWFSRKEPYFCTLIALIIFSPVIYWNATHEWASFFFQSSRRFQEHFQFTLPEFFILLLTFLTPAGLIATWLLMKEKKSLPTENALFFLKIYTIFPLLFFCIFSICHPIRFNWIGPGMLAVIPWLAATFANNRLLWFLLARKAWILTASLLLVFYVLFFLCLFTGKPAQVNKALFRLMSWNNFTQQMIDICEVIEKQYGKKPIIVPLDNYNISSELSFYQRKLSDNKKINSEYPVYGADIFGFNSLMYKYWAPIPSVENTIVLLVSRDKNRFAYPLILKNLTSHTPINEFWSLNQKLNQTSTKFYYQVGHINPVA